jgi:ABC-type Mn2+/Zn2+ transport system permease subunit
MMDLFSLEFFRNAFIAGILLSILFGLISFVVVLRRMAFLGAGIAHTAFGGVALGILLGIHPFYTSVVFCMCSAVLIGRLVKSGNVSYDTGIGIFFSFAMALGAIFIAMRKAYTFDLSGYLFGNILGVTTTDLLLIIGTLTIFLPFYLLYFQKILFMTFETTVAEVSGVRTEALETLLLMFLAVIIVVSIKIVGIILVSALIVLPASFGLLLYNDYRRVLGSGVLFALFAMSGGLFLSYALDLPAGAMMVVLATTMYFASWLIRSIVRGG